MNQNPDQIYKDAVEQGVRILMQSFDLCIKELFKKPLVISNETKNPFSELPPHIQMSIVQGAFQQSLGNSLASMRLMAPQSVTDKEVFSAGSAVLRHFYTLYLKGMRENYERNKKNMGKGPGAGDGGGGDVLGGAPLAGNHKCGEPLCENDHHGQDGVSRSKALADKT